jgi:transposase
MAKVYDLNLYEYIKFLLENRPSQEMSDDELAKLAPWNETVRNFARIK